MIRCLIKCHLNFSIRIQMFNKKEQNISLELSISDYSNIAKVPKDILKVITKFVTYIKLDPLQVASGESH